MDNDGFRLSMSLWRQTKSGLLWLGLCLPLVLYGVNSLRRPSRIPILEQPLFEGIVYSRVIKDQPRSTIIHSVGIDLSAPGLVPFVTAGYAGTDSAESKPWETTAQRTSEFIETEGVQLAVNANFFYPFKEVTPWNYRPRSGQPANLVGLAISNGDVVSEPDPERTSLCFGEQQAIINHDGTCPDTTQQAVAGNLMLLANGQPTDDVQQQIIYEGHKPYSFPIAALDASGTRLWFVLVDGKQPF